MDRHRLYYLFTKYYDKSASHTERDELFTYLSDNKNEIDDEIVRQLFNEKFLISNDNDVDFNESRIWHNIKGKSDEYSAANNTKTHNILKYLSVAAILVAIGIFTLFISKYYRDSRIESTSSIISHDVPPGGNKAILTLADGSKVNLDTLSVGTLINDNDTYIEKLDNGQIRYSTAANPSNSINYNVIQTPVGGTFQIKLPDGSLVCLNALSKMKYPIQFNSDIREIELNGEAYFEIAHDKSRPFYINTETNNKIKVLGTKFNVKSYDKVTLTSVVEGSVSVNSKIQSKILKRNQALLISKDEFEFYDNRNVSEDISWKDGYFSRKNIRLVDMLDQISRWYGVRIINEDNVDLDLVISVRKDMYLSDLIKILELTNEVKLTYKNEIIYVKKGN